MRFGVVAILGLIAGVGAAQAQQAQTWPPLTKAPPLKSLPTTAVVVAGPTCPVGALWAQRRSAGETVWAISREDSKDPAFVKKQGNSGVHVDLKSSRGALQQLEFSVSYIAPGARVMLVDAPDKDEMRQKTFEISVDGTSEVGRDLLVGPAFQITHVHLVSATFADGEVWRAANESACNVVPSGFLLVKAK